MTAKPTTQQARQLIGRAGRGAQRKVRRFVEEYGQRPTTAAPRSSAAPTTPRLAPTTALYENGFTVFRGLFPAAECARLAHRLKTEAGITEGERFTKVDATNFFPTARDLLLEGRIVDAVRSALGEQPRFLQVADLHYLHDTANWHRDSVHRAKDSSESPDWRPDAPPYRVVKAILYLESDNAAMGYMAASHRSPIEMDRAAVKQVEDAGGQLVIDADDDPNRRLVPTEKGVPLAWKAQAGDVLVFDERMYHAGRRVDNGKVTANREAAKFTLSMVFGADNEHSERLYSYFRYVRRELHYQELPDSLRDELAARDLVLDRGWVDFYRENPQDLRHVYLQGGLDMTELLKEYGAVSA